MAATNFAFAFARISLQKNGWHTPCHRLQASSKAMALFAGGLADGGVAAPGGAQRNVGSQRSNSRPPPAYP